MYVYVVIQLHPENDEPELFQSYEIIGAYKLLEDAEYIKNTYPEDCIIEIETVYFIETLK